MKNEHKKNDERFKKEDMHNVIAKSSFDFKLSIAKMCNYDIEEVKKLEKNLADAINKGLKEADLLIEYMNTEI